MTNKLLQWARLFFTECHAEFENVENLFWMRKVIRKFLKMSENDFSKHLPVLSISFKNSRTSQGFKSTGINEFRYSSFQHYTLKNQSNNINHCFPEQKTASKFFTNQTGKTFSEYNKNKQTEYTSKFPELLDRTTRQSFSMSA